jgi:hypothetical protein
MCTCNLLDNPVLPAISSDDKFYLLGSLPTCHGLHKNVNHVNCVLDYMNHLSITIRKLFSCANLTDCLFFIIQFIVNIESIQMTILFLIIENIQNMVLKQYPVAFSHRNKLLPNPSLPLHISYLQSFEPDIHYGGGRSFHVVPSKLLESRLIKHNKCSVLNTSASYRFVNYLLNINLADYHVENNHSVLCRFTLSEASIWLTNQDIITTAKRHGINLATNTRRSDIMEVLTDHTCESCLYHACMFEEIQKPSQKPVKLESFIQCEKHIGMKNEKQSEPPKFPPDPISKKMAEKIINGFCLDSDPTILQEAGCAVCGRLSQMSDLLYHHLRNTEIFSKLLLFQV